MGRKSEEAAATAITLRKNRLLALQGALDKSLLLIAAIHIFTQSGISVMSITQSILKISQSLLPSSFTMLMIITMMMVMMSMMMCYILEPGKAVGGCPGHEAVGGKECGQDKGDQHLCN